ncbi:MAG: hypothetical protein F6J90_15325 [Moorea sp. SIOASIH]|uniref:hypothetical protein n=1 Tax=Moorena sp. SIOASIH TaxID=2607817 RepID=UPI0013B6A000|nr:hypothetical protein [Moorena sp. SIOASIH]NEO37625.1 hypothetical protein [Moorena sp. SIOASIH]
MTGKQVVQFMMVVLLGMVLWATPAKADSLIACVLPKDSCSGTLSKGDILNVTHDYGDKGIELLLTPVSTAKITYMEDDLINQDVDVSEEYRIDISDEEYMIVFDEEGQVNYQIEYTK